MSAIIALVLLLIPLALRAESSPVEPTRLLWTDGVQNAYPRWSKDGSQILFQSNRSGKWQIYVMNRDGSGEQQLTHDDANQNFPDWSPDNMRLAFVSDRDGNEEVYVMAMDGSGLKNLSNNPGRDIHPYWAPDGKRLLFNSSRDNETSFEIYEVNADGSGLKRLTQTDAVETCARFLPDQNKIVCPRGANNDDVVVLDANGGDPVNVTHSAAAEGWPTWAPDGRHIIYSTDAPGAFSLFLVTADGSDPRQLTFPTAPLYDARAMISPDGATVVFNRQTAETIGIFLLPLAAPKPQAG